VALTVAGSDSGGGAGIQADLKAMTHVGVHGCTAITALTAQNSRGVDGIDPVDPSFVEEQIRSVAGDFDVRATKTGMLFSRPIIETVVDHADSLGRLVVDPVMVATSGDSLLEPEAERAIADLLLPEADLVTPNWPETKKLVRALELDTEGSPDELGDRLTGEYDSTVFLIKGGHSPEEDAVDYLCRDGEENRTYRTERMDTENTHGAGCAYSSLIAAYLARGRSLDEAVGTAKDELTRALESGYAAGSGAGTLNFLTDPQR
jgi:hydroxymethylpyrimidine/phosphomethylpyrimidine kinase